MIRINYVPTTALFALACAIYAILLTNGHPINGDFALINSSTSGFNLVFNSMASSLLQGRFDVAPDIVGSEGFLVNGRVIAYWGIPFAVIRLPLALSPSWLQLDVTGLSTLVAVCVACFAKLRSLRLVFRKAAVPPSGALYWLITLTILFSGPQIEFLKISVYQEVCLWAGALSALFVYCALKGVLDGSFSSRLLCGIATIAGLALLSRPSTGIGLYTASILLLAACIALAGNNATAATTKLFKPAILAPLAIILGFGCLVAFVNYERWGSPWVFADYHFYIENLRHPERLDRMATYGLFNLRRFPSSFAYYLFPVWVLPSPTGGLLFEQLQTRLYDFTELPPATFLLTDVALLGLAGYALRSTFSWSRKGSSKRILTLAVAVGLSAPCGLMLTAISLAYRYRIEFYPLLEFSAFLGVYLLLGGSASPRPTRPARLNYIVAAGATISIVTSGCALLLYKLSQFGTGTYLMHFGFWTYYTDRWHDQVTKLLHSFN